MKLTTRQKNILLGIAALLLLGVVIWLILDLRNPQPEGPSSGIVRSSPTVINPQGDTSLVDTDRFQINFIPRYNQYQVSVLASPFEAVRREAEDALADYLQAPPEQLCQLNIAISTPAFVNPEQSGKIYPLSICAGVSPKPDLTIDPKLTPITFVRVTPPAGRAEMAGTTNSLNFEFSNKLNLNTVLVNGTPTTAFKVTNHLVENNVLVVIPRTPWQDGATYTITIQAGARSADGTQQLKEDVIVTYEMRSYVFPSEPNHGGI